MSNEPTISLTRSDITLLQALESARRRPCLVLFSGDDRGRPFTLDSGATVVGRSPDVALHLDSPGISRRHAELQVGETMVTLRDLGSYNGTYVNETRVEGEVALREGDLIRLGNLLLKFYEHHSLDAALHDRIYRLATVDAGTEVFNRRYLFDTLRREFRLARMASRPLSVISYDLDRFKAVNDQHGHAAGDLVLKQSSAAVRAALQGAGVLGRLGGEEFAVILPHVDLPAAADLAERLRRAVAEHTIPLISPTAGKVAHRQTISLGVATLADTMQDVTELLEAADRKVYQSKHAGRNRVSL